MNMYKYKINSLTFKESGYLFNNDILEALRRFVEMIKNVEINNYINNIINSYGVSEGTRINIKFNDLELLFIKVKNEELDKILENDIFQLIKKQIEKSFNYER